MVLVADADEGVRSLARLTLEGESYRVVEAAGTEEALRGAAAHLPAVMLLDAELPGPGGLAIARSLKAQPETRGIRIVLLSHRERPVGDDDAAHAGVDAELAKPFTAFALLHKVDAVLR